MLLTVTVLSLIVFALAVGCRSIVGSQLLPTGDGLVLGGPPADRATVSTTDLTAAPTSAGTTATPTTTASPDPARTTAPPPAPPAPPPPAPPPPGPPPPGPQPGSMTDVAQALLDQINAWRAADGKAPLTMASGLVASAHKHNLLMSAGCGMVHQCPDEAGLGARIGTEGISWRAVAENIAWHSSTSSSGALAAAKGLNEAMHNETPPNDGHRRNMLSDSYRRIGIDVIRDADGEVWVTEDFAN